MIDGVINADALPVLERLMQFAGARHRVIVDNIANLSTPEHRPVDLSVDLFQGQLGEAIDRRREVHGARGGDLVLEATAQVESAGPHRLDVHPVATGDNLLFHDRNDRDLDRTMQDLVENFMAFRTAAQFMRGHFELINSAIRERI